MKGRMRVIIFLAAVGTFFYTAGGFSQDAGAPAEIKVKNAEIASPQAPEQPSKEKKEEEKRKKAERRIFKIGKAEIKLLLINPEPVFLQGEPSLEADIKEEADEEERL